VKTNPTLPCICQLDVPASDSSKQSLTLDVRKETLVLGRVANETLQRTADHGVLAHQDNTLAAHGLTNLVHLLRRDIVDSDNENGAVVLEQALQLVEVAGLVCSFAPHLEVCTIQRDVSG